MSDSKETTAVIARDQRLDIRTETMLIVKELKASMIDVRMAVIKKMPEYSSPKSRQLLTRILCGFKADSNVLQTLRDIKSEYSV